MNKIEKIRAEIERLKAELKDGNYYLDNNEQAIGYELSLGDLLSFLDALSEEPVSEDLEKASRNVYESWMGGTIDDVRRDMVELGKVLNARKEDKK